MDSFVGCSFHCALHPPALEFLVFQGNHREKRKEVLRLFRRSTHAHTPRPAGLVAKARAVKWKDEDDKEMKMKGYSTGTQDGERKRREEEQRENTWPGAGEPWKGKGKEKTEADGNKPRPAEGGEGRTHLNKPTPAKPKPTKERKDPNLPGTRSTHEIGETTKTTQKSKGFSSMCSCSHYRIVVGPPTSGHVTAARIFTNWVHNWLTSPR